MVRVRTLVLVALLALSALATLGGLATFLMRRTKHRRTKRQQAAPSGAVAGHRSRAVTPARPNRAATVGARSGPSPVPQNFGDIEVNAAPFA